MRKRDFTCLVRMMILALAVAGALAGRPAHAGEVSGAGTGWLNVRDFGAVGDGKALETAAIQKAIDAAARRGGGTVLLPAGTYLSAPLFLKSHVTLHIDSGATLKGSRNMDDYPTVEGRWEGFVVRHRASLVTAIDAEGVAVVGRGTIDGQGDVWWKVLRERKARENALKAQAKAREKARAAGKGSDAGTSATQAAAAQTAAPAEPAEFPRPRLLNFIRCRNVLVQGVKLVNSPAWTVHPAFCENVVVDGITIDNPADSPNTDGVNPDSCVNVRIANCLLNCGDDCVTLKSGKDEEGRRFGRPTENVTITNCVMLAGHGGVVIGSEMSGGVRDVTVSNCVFRGTDQGIRIKSQRGRGGVVEDLTFSNIVMHNIVKNGIILTMFYSGKDQPAQPVNEGTPLFRNITISNIRINGAQAAGAIEGLEELPMKNIRLNNIDARTSAGLTITRAEGVTLERVAVDVQKGSGLTINRSADIKVDDFKAVQKDVKAPAIVLKEAENVWVRNCQAEPKMRGNFLKVEGAAPKRLRLTDNDIDAAAQPDAKAVVKNGPSGQRQNQILSIDKPKFNLFDVSGLTVHLGCSHVAADEKGRSGGASK